MRRVTVVLLALGLLGTAAAAEEIGVAQVVKPQVLAFPPRKPSHDLVERDPIERGLRVKLIRGEAFLQVFFTPAFGCKLKTYKGGKISDVVTLVGASDAVLGDPARSCAPAVRFNSGKLNLAQLPGEPPFDVDTPETRSIVQGTYVRFLAAVSSPAGSRRSFNRGKLNLAQLLGEPPFAADTSETGSIEHGTYVRFLADPIVGTFVGVDEGVVTVQAKAGGDPVEVEAGEWVLVPPGGLASHPAPLHHLDEPDDSPFRMGDFTTQPPRRPPG